MERTARGRVATPLCYERLKLPRGRRSSTGPELPLG
jgi:hypothetical protein